MLKVNRCTNANIYLEGGSLLGQAEEIDSPDIKFKQSEHKALGLVGSFEIFSGIEKVEQKIKWNSFYPDALKTIGDPTKVLSFQIRASLEAYESEGRTSEVPVVIYVKGQTKNLPTGMFKQHDNVELTTSFSCLYCKMEINGDEIFEYDVLANIFKVAGNDILANYRANLGI